MGYIKNHALNSTFEKPRVVKCISIDLSLLMYYYTYAKAFWCMEL